jgi:hypothetical protein
MFAWAARFLAKTAVVPAAFCSAERLPIKLEINDEITGFRTLRLGAISLAVLVAMEVQAYHDTRLELLRRLVCCTSSLDPYKVSVRPYIFCPTLVMDVSKNFRPHIILS